MYVWEEFKNAGVVPCNERVRFNNLIGERLTFRANKRTYSVNCDKGAERSAMYGRGWRKFVADNKLGKGQLVFFYLDQPSPRAVVCVIQFGNATDDEKSMDEDDNEVLDEDDEDGEAPSDDDEGIICTRGLELNEEDDLELEGLLPLNDGFIGFPFVHLLTRTDVELGSLKIPKKVAAALPFEEQVVVGVCVDGGRFRKIPYNTSDDRCIVFGRKKWKEFAASRDLAVNTVVLIGFQDSPRDKLDLLLSIKKLG